MINNLQDNQNSFDKNNIKTEEPQAEQLNKRIESQNQQEQDKSKANKRTRKHNFTSQVNR